MLAPDRFLLIEDNVTFRELLRSALAGKYPDGQIDDVGSAAEAREKLGRAAYALIIVDLYLGDGDGWEVIQSAQALPTPPRCLVLTGRPDPSLPAELLSIGVGGLVDKSSPLEHLLHAVSRVLAGGMFFSTQVTPGRPGGRTLGPEVKAPAPSVLSEQELRIVQLVTQGSSSKQIGAALHMSPRTVEKHRALLMQKLRLSDLPALVRWAVRHRVS